MPIEGRGRFYTVHHRHEIEQMRRTELQQAQAGMTSALRQDIVNFASSALERHNAGDSSNREVKRNFERAAAKLRYDMQPQHIADQIRDKSMRRSATLLTTSLASREQVGAMLSEFAATSNVRLEQPKNDEVYDFHLTRKGENGMPPEQVWLRLVPGPHQVTEEEIPFQGLPECEGAQHGHVEPGQHYPFGRYDSLEQFRAALKVFQDETKARPLQIIQFRSTMPVQYRRQYKPITDSRPLLPRTVQEVLGGTDNELPPVTPFATMAMPGYEIVETQYLGSDVGYFLARRLGPDNTLEGTNYARLVAAQRYRSAFEVAAAKRIAQRAGISRPKAGPVEHREKA